MSAYKLYCRGESGNCYKVALMLDLVAADWEPEFVDFFNPDSKAAFIQTVNPQGELPVLQRPDGKLLTQSGAILDYLSRATGRYAPASDEDRQEVLRWLLFDNHRFTPAFATLRFMIGIRGADENQLTGYLRAQAQAAYEIVDAHLAGRRFMVGDAPTVADISMAGYLYYKEDARFDRSQFVNVQAWADRISALPRWRHPYELMPRAIREGN